MGHESHISLNSKRNFSLKPQKDLEMNFEKYHFGVFLEGASKISSKIFIQLSFQLNFDREAIRVW